MHTYLKKNIEYRNVDTENDLNILKHSGHNYCLVFNIVSYNYKYSIYIPL